MTKLNEGDNAPDFSLPTDGDKTITLSELKGKSVVIYFYPKDDTPGCTKESCDFRDNIKFFEENNIQILGVSKDSVKKHDKFKDKYDLNFPLISDEECKMIEAYGVWVEKSMYGRKYMGIERTTFLIDENGVIRKIWSKVKVPGHVEDVMKTAQGLAEAA